ncbi:MAG: hypothetical protein WA071_21315 [Undibacterium umbellatum]|uniref:hypothetical protein n=1 Tax=Undibacterium umbellatum TaxID=2762300 RepID=UPI003BB7A90B
MSESPDEKDTANSDEENAIGAIVKLTFACLAYGLFVYLAWNDIGPSGQTTSLGSFLMFLFPEILWFGFFGLLIIVGGIVWIVRFIRKLFPCL